MRLFAGLVGASVGLVIGAVAASSVATFQSAGDEFGGVLLGVMYAPYAMGLGAAVGVVNGLCVLRYRRSASWSGSTRRRKALLRTVLVLAPGALVWGLASGIDRLTGPPCDDALLAHFKRHQAALDEVVRLAQADKRLQRVNADDTLTADAQTSSLPPARAAQYRRLLKSAGVKDGYQSDDVAGEIDMDYWGQGSAISSDFDKGFAYLPTPPAHTLPSLDGCGPGGENVFKAYRHITGRWYMFYDYLPG